MYSWVPSSMHQCSVCHCYEEFKGFFFLMSKTKCQTRRKYLSQYAIILRHINTVACYAPEHHNVLIHVLLEQLHLALAKPFQQLYFHICQIDWVVWLTSKAHSSSSNLDSLRSSVSETKIFPSNACYRKLVETSLDVTQTRHEYGLLQIFIGSSWS